MKQPGQTMALQVWTQLARIYEVVLNGVPWANYPDFLQPSNGWIETRPRQAEWIAYHTPSGQIPAADVCGSGAVYLCSDAASHVHGQMLLIDGGMSAWQQPPTPKA